MAPRKTKTNPRHRVYLPKPERSARGVPMGPRQGALFKSTTVFPGHPDYPAELTRRGQAEQALSKVPGPATGFMRSHEALTAPTAEERSAGEPATEDFVYSEMYPDQRPYDAGYTPLRQQLSGRRQGLLLADADDLYHELDTLADAIGGALDGWVASREYDGGERKEMERVFEESLSEDDEWQVEAANTHPTLATLIARFPAELMDAVRDVLKNSACWKFYNKAPPSEGRSDAAKVDANCGFNGCDGGYHGGDVDWNHEDAEFHIEIDAKDLKVDPPEEGGPVNLRRYLFPVTAARPNEYMEPTVDDVIDRARVLFTEIEGDTSLAEEALEMWLEAAARGVDEEALARGEEVVTSAYRKQHQVRMTYEGKYDETGKNRGRYHTHVSEAVANIKIEAFAMLRVAYVEQELQNTLEAHNIEDVAPGPPGPDDELDDVVRRARVAQISNATVQLPYVFDPQAAGVTGLSGSRAASFLTGTDWSVWNLSSADAEAEGRAMMHCAANYDEAIGNKEIYMWSVKNGTMKGLFTIEVKRGERPRALRDEELRGTENRIVSFAQIKGKQNRLPGWAMKRDYDPYPPADREPYTPRTFEVAGANGSLLPPLSVEDVRRDEVLLLWQLIQQVVSLEDLYAVTPRWQNVKFDDWTDCVEALDDQQDAALDANGELYENQRDTLAGYTRSANALYTLKVFCQDMIPGLVAVFTGKLFNAAPTPRTNPRARGRTNGGPALRMSLESRSFAVDYVPPPRSRRGW